MKKRVYFVQEFDNSNGWHHIYTYDLDEARKSARYHWDRRTKSERDKSTFSIWGYDVEYMEDAKEAFHKATEELCWLPDPDFYEECEFEN